MPPRPGHSCRPDLGARNWSAGPEYGQTPRAAKDLMNLSGEIFGLQAGHSVRLVLDRLDVPVRPVAS